MTRYRDGTVLTLAVCMVLTTGTMTWLGYRATREWERSTRVSVERRGNEVLALLATALSYDMKGAQVSVLIPINQSSLTLSRPYDLADRFARAFARFSYPESFFSWKSPQDPESVLYFFSRSDRSPPWRKGETPRDVFPVVIDSNPAPVRDLALAARNQALGGVPFAVFETDIGGVRYQTLVQFIYNYVGESSQLFGLVGFTVNLEWVRDHYFDELIAQIERIGGERDTIGLEILDDENHVVTTAGPTSSNGPAQVRRFPLIFADRTVLSSLPRSQRPSREWTARVSVANDPSLQAAGRGSARAFWLLAIASMVTIVALAVSVHAAREAAELAAMKSAFISTVSHEMKTPLSLIRLASDTLFKGRYTSSETINEYTQILASEAEQLTQLIDNILSYVRISDRKDVYTFEPVDLTEIVEDALERFDPKFAELKFDLQLQLPHDIGRVRADRGLMRQAIENLIDNAIKYAASGGSLVIRVWEADHRVHLEMTDRGDGIAADEVGRVFDKFYRGRGVSQRGSGLGLSIVKQIIEDHGGKVAVRSAVGHGTSINISIPSTHST